MLANMEDPASIGPAMAVALLTTLYGAILATMIFLPLADKLNLRMTEEARMNAMLIDAVTAIQSGSNPRVVEQLVNSYLPPKQRAALILRDVCGRNAQRQVPKLRWRLWICRLPSRICKRGWLKISMARWTTWPATA